MQIVFVSTMLVVLNFQYIRRSTFQSLAFFWGEMSFFHVTTLLSHGDV
jgi:hypothetical protein